MFGWLKKNTVTTVSLDQLADIAGFVRYGTTAGIDVTPQTAVEATAVLCAVRVLSEDMAKMPVRVIQETYEGNKVRRVVARDHWAHRLLATRPNEFQTPFEYREYAIIACILDDGFLGIKNTVNGEVREILPLPMGSWSIERNASNWGHYFRVSYANGTHGAYLPSQVVYMRGPSLDGWRGLNGLQAIREAIGLSRAMEKQQARLAGNGGKPSGVLSFDEALKPEQREKLRKTWQERFGPNGEGGVAVLDGAAKFQSMVMTSVDAQHLETRNFQVEEVARGFRVHPNKLMHSGNQATFASAESFERSHVGDSILPWVLRFEQVHNRDVLNNEDGLVVDVEERALLRGDFKDQAEYFTKALGAGGQPGWLSVNEVRQTVGENPIEEDWADQVPRGVMSEGMKDDGLE
jgi:HK97 family phage portal protein